MSFLEKMGLGAKKSPDAPNIGKKKKKEEQASTFKNNIYVKIGIIVSFFVILFITVPQPSFYQQFDYQIGKPWMNENLTAPFTFAIQKSDQQLAREKKEVRKHTPPLFHRKNETNAHVKSSLASTFKKITTIQHLYQQSNVETSDTTSTKKKQFIRQINSNELSLSYETWNTILSADFNVSLLKKNLKNIIDDILEDGVLNRSKEKLNTKYITLRNLESRTQQTVNIANLRDIQQASQHAKYRLSQLYPSNITKAGLEIFNRVISPNIIYQAEETKRRIKEAVANISTTIGAIGEGQIIIRKGDIVTPKKYRILQSLAEARSQQATNLEKWLKIGGNILVIIAVMVIFFFYMYLYRRQIFKNNSMLLLVLITISAICVGSALLANFTDVPLFIVPIAIAPIILTIIFDSRVGIVSTLALALIVGLISSNSFEFVTATIVACILGLFSVRDIKKRSQFFFITPGIVFISYALVIIGFSMTSPRGWDPLLDKLLYIFLNTLFILFTYPLILLFERTFNITTDLTLIELGDTNLPLLNNLMTKAPGTFHHSLQVANLAEAAAGAIRANGLLCRVGALYHDIGKMDHPEYFTENQTATNELENLKPRMSALVIKAHVSNGVKMAKEHSLPNLLINFIETHHGTSVIKFFYEKALEESDQDKDEIKVEDFRYDGPLPQTKETGILMLADCVEAASRSMQDPNYQKLDGLVDKLIDKRVQNGQLSETPLTFRDLSIIKQAFLKILIGIYHSRVEYPDDEKAPGDRSTANHDNPKKKKDKIKQKEKDEKASKDSKSTQSPEKNIGDYYNS